MADERIDHDYSGRPLRPLDELEPGGEYPVDLIITFDRKGNEVVRWTSREYYYPDESGYPDFDRPVPESEFPQAGG